MPTKAEGTKKEPDRKKAALVEQKKRGRGEGVQNSGSQRVKQSYSTQAPLIGPPYRLKAILDRGGDRIKGKRSEVFQGPKGGVKNRPTVMSSPSRGAEGAAGRDDEATKKEPLPSAEEGVRSRSKKSRGVEGVEGRAG